MKTAMTRLAYCQYLLVSQITYPLTNCADHCDAVSHDAVTRYRRGERITPRLVWDNVRGQVVPTARAYLSFDDSVLDQDYSHQIERVRRQWSGNAKAVITGIGVGTCVYVNPEAAQCWLIDSRLSDPDGDGKTKLDHAREMLDNVVHHQRLPFHAVLRDTWSATTDWMRHGEALQQGYYCPLRDTWLVDDSAGVQPYRPVDSLDWSPAERAHGKAVKIKGFPQGHKVRRFRVEVSTHRTDWVVTNDLAQDSVEATRQGGGFRWQSEQLHREGKPLTGLERCQCRRARLQRNHSGGAFLVWGRRKPLAAPTGRPVYQLNPGLLDDYLIQQLKTPSLEMVLA